MPATYLNHYELVTLMLALCVALPMSNAWSLDRRAGRVVEPGPGHGGRSRSASSGPLRAQLGVVYVFAGAGQAPDRLARPRSSL